MPEAQSAVAILVPEAEALVSSYRDAFDPSARVGMPAHVTLLHPFVEPEAIESGVFARLGRCFAGFAAFDFALTEARRFPDRVLYLAIEPEAPFRELTLAIWRAFPENPPYGGRYPTIVPHLTIADRQRALQLDEIGRDFDRAARGKLPIRSRADMVVLLDNRSGRWQRRAGFPLAHPTAA